jgi:hypothetical protein
MGTEKNVNIAFEGSGKHPDERQKVRIAMMTNPTYRAMERVCFLW